jgi:hypothetical protein
MSEASRRDFLRLSAAGLAAGAAAEALPAWSSTAASPVRTADSPNGEIIVRVTDEKRRFESASALAWRKSSSPPSAETVVLNPEKKFQEILASVLPSPTRPAICSANFLQTRVRVFELFRHHPAARRCRAHGFCRG